MSTREFKGSSLLDLVDDYVVIDLETTGLSPRHDHIIEIAALRIRNGMIADSYSSLINPEQELDPFITELTGITNEDLQDAPLIDTILPEALNFIGSDIVIAHNAHFDINFLYDASEVVLGKPFTNSFVDTLRLSRKLFPDEESHSLESLIRKFEISQTVEHRALSDAVNAHECYAFMKAYAKVHDADLTKCSESKASGKKSGPAIKPLELEKAVHTLAGIIQGIIIDESVNDMESDDLRDWCEQHDTLRCKHPFSEIIPAIENCLDSPDSRYETLLDILWLCSNYSSNSKYFNLITNSIQMLHGIFHGILSDGRISDQEILNLKNWLTEHDFLKGTYPYDEISSLLASILADQKIDDDERELLKAFFSTFIEQDSTLLLKNEQLHNLNQNYALNGICNCCPDIVVNEKCFCFTGESQKAKRSEIESIIIDHGGLFSSSVSKKVDYLIIGNNGNPCWMFSCYGRKVEKAVELRKKGHQIAIINELDFWNVLEK